MNPDRIPDADALAEHAAFVRAVARAALKGDDAVDDVVQDTYAAALASGPSKPGSLRAWLAGVARRQAAARIRRRAMRRRHAPLLPQPGTDETTLDVAARAETSRQVVDAVMRLNEPYRSALLLRYWDDLPPREIAKRKEVPVETARTWIKRGLGQLRARLERDHGPGRDGWKAVLLPLVFVPKSGAALATTAAVGGVLAMKKLAALAIGLLLVAGSALWWNTTPPREAHADGDPGGALRRRPTHTGPASLDGVSSAARRMETDAAGAGETQLPTGRYRLRAHAQGFSPCVVDDVDVLEGERTETAVRLHVGLVVDVRVVGPEAEAVSGALVRLAGPLRSGGQGRTDPEGRCAVPGIAPPAEPDDYWASMVFYQVEARGYALRFGYRRLPGDGKTYELEIPLVRGVPVRLHVVDDAGVPLEGVEASLALDSNAANALPSSVTFSTDASGWVDLPRLGPRTYGVTLVSREAGFQYEQVELVVGAEAIEREVVLARRRASLAGTVLLPDGSPATGGKVGVVASDADRARRLAAGGTEIGADGAFLLGNLKGGEQVLVASVPGFLPQWQEIEVVAGQQREGYAFRLERRGRIRGRVLTWDDAPLADAEVQMEVRIVTEIGGRTMQTGTFLPVAATDAKGRFEILGVDDELLKLTVQREGWERAWPWPEDVRAGTDDAVFVMKPASEGSGMPLIARVLADGQPYDGKLSAAVMDPGGGNLLGTLPPVALGDGRYEVRIHFRDPGPYDLRLTAPGWRPFEVHGVEVRHRPPRPEVSVTLDRGATLASDPRKPGSGDLHRISESGGVGSASRCPPPGQAAVARCGGDHLTPPIT